MSIRKTITKPIFGLIRFTAQRLNHFAAFRKWVKNKSTAQDAQITKKHFSLPTWPENKPHLKIAVLADFHFGAHSDDLDRFSKIIETTNAFKPDLTLLVGDFLNTPHFGQDLQTSDKIAAILQKFSADLGVWAVLGNHDWKHGGAQVWQDLEKVGINVLENGSAHLSFNGVKFDLVGMADDSTRKTNWNKALETVDNKTPTLIMAHDPASFIKMPQNNGIMFSGHTHGGQIRIPALGAVVNSSRAPLRWSQGHITKPNKQLFVTRGLGTSILPLRINCPPEICLFTVGSAQK